MTRIIEYFKKMSNSCLRWIDKQLEKLNKRMLHFEWQTDLNVNLFYHDKKKERKKNAWS